MDGAHVHTDRSIEELLRVVFVEAAGVVHGTGLSTLTALREITSPTLHRQSRNALKLAKVAGDQRHPA